LYGDGVCCGNHAIGDSFNMIQRGDAEAMICGGAESTITPMSIAGFAAMRALSMMILKVLPGLRSGSRWIRGRRRLRHHDSGGVGTRACAWRSHLCRDRRYGMTGDAYHITAPDETKAE